MKFQTLIADLNSNVPAPYFSSNSLQELDYWQNSTIDKVQVTSE